ncbi:hypothetical protein HK405_009706 [Cladochytrium tenue]|nr:hypothetical protein HK405_009706 [Cladochytrium tenue]
MGLARGAPDAAAAAAAAAGGAANTQSLAHLLRFAPCPRAFPGSLMADDWMRHPRFPSFVICQSCFQTSVGVVPQYARLFYRNQPPGPSDRESYCDFSLIWVRMAWVWIMGHALPDVDLLGHVATIAMSDGCCPNPRDKKALIHLPTVTRQWFTLRHPADGRLLADEWTICSHCKTAIETILPVFRDKRLFVPAAQMPCPGCCDLPQQRVWGCLQYMFNYASEIYFEGKSGDLMPLINHIVEYSGIPPCPKDTPKDGLCHFIPDLRDFTVCQECFIAVVKPSIEKGAGSRLAASVQTSPVFVQNWTCQLYSDRTRRLWAECTTTTTSSDAAVAAGDSLGGAEARFRLKAAERRAKERDVYQRTSQLRDSIRLVTTQVGVYGAQMLAQTQVQSAQMVAQVMIGYEGGYVTPSNPLILHNQALMGQERVKAEMLQCELDSIVADWTSNWE